MPEEIVLGTTHVRLDNQEFLDGMDIGIEKGLLHEEPKPHITLTDIYRIIWRAMINDATGADPAPESFRAGFAFGQLCALLHPDLDAADEHLTWVEALGEKYVAKSKPCMAVTAQTL